jgi:hypothetical protein
MQERELNRAKLMFMMVFSVLKNKLAVTLFELN